ncbi:MAG: imidazolonepropionase [Planctomycetota bacterium]|nr:MAG: imidazolonepropionase [Planctomycetota bacterium]
MPEPVDLIITNISRCATLRGAKRPRTGAELERLSIVKGAAIAVRHGRIVAVGKARSVSRKVRPKQIIDAGGRFAAPGFVDPHTHIVFAASREHEFDMRVRGKSYVEITRAGGGIHNSVRMLRKATRRALQSQAMPRLDRMLSHGTTTAEVKSGYGLTLRDEIKMLEVIRNLGRRHPVDLVPTFLGAHEIPREYRRKKNRYIELLINEMLPRVASRRLAEFCDIFTEAHVYNIKDSRRILTAARDLGFKLKLHADEIKAMGGAELAGELGAVSADHLVMVSPRGIRAMAKGGVIPVLLPATSFALGAKAYAPARKMIEAGLPVALATDCNPGTSMTENMQFVLSIACTQLRMTPAEALTAATINAAYAIGRGDRVGSLDIGKAADIVLYDAPDERYIPYHMGVNHAACVLKNGKAHGVPYAGHTLL